MSLYMILGIFALANYVVASYALMWLYMRKEFSKPYTKVDVGDYAFVGFFWLFSPLLIGVAIPGYIIGKLLLWGIKGYNDGQKTV